MQNAESIQYSLCLSSGSSQAVRFARDRPIALPIVIDQEASKSQFLSESLERSVTPPHPN
jgi:hypothetical protein